MEKKDINIRQRNKVTPNNYYGKDLCLMATDVEALFPTLDPREASRIFKVVVVKSDVNFNAMDHSEALLYIHLNAGCVQMKHLENIRDHLP